MSALKSLKKKNKLAKSVKAIKNMGSSVKKASNYYWQQVANNIANP